MGRKVSECMGEQVARARHRRNWTQQRTADAVKEHDPDSKLGRAAIAKIESGVRGLSVDELLLLAAALNVPPVLLLLPLGTEDEVEITPRSSIHPHLALDWFCGDEPLTTSDLFAIQVGDWYAGAEPVTLYRELREVQNASSRAGASVSSAGYAGDEERMRAARSQRADALTALHAHLRRMQKAAIRPPGQTQEVLDEMESLGLDVRSLPTWEPSERMKERRAGEGA